MIMSLSIILRMREVSDKSCTENKNTHFLCTITFFPKNCAVCEIMWENMVEPDRPQMVIRCMCCACWISKGTDTHSEYEVLVAVQQQQWLHTCASMLRSYMNSNSGYTRVPPCYVRI